MRQQEHTGAGILIQNMSDNKKQAISLKLRNSLTVPEVEYLAIIMATKIAQKLNGKVLILSDSKAAIYKFKQQNLNLKDITLTWTPAHKGVLGNEAADRLAKAGVTNKKVRWAFFWDQLEDNFPDI